MGIDDILKAWERLARIAFGGIAVSGTGIDVRSLGTRNELEVKHNGVSNPIVKNMSGAYPTGNRMTHINNAGQLVIVNNWS